MIAHSVEYLRARQDLEFRKKEAHIAAVPAKGGSTQARTKRLQKLIAEEERVLAQRLETRPTGFIPETARCEHSVE